MNKMDVSPINILFSSAGRRVELLRAFRQAYDALGLPGNIVGLDIDALAPTGQVADRFYLVPRYNDPAYLPTLIDICQREQIHLVFPLIDPEILIMAENRAALEATGTRLALVPLEAAQIANDKWLTYEFFKRIGVPTPRSWLPEHLPSADLPDFPVFIKPRSGSSSVNAFKVNNARELDFFKDYIRDPIIQEFLPGEEFSHDVISDLDGVFLSVITRKRLLVRSGEVARGVTAFHPLMADYCRQIVAALPAVGPITTQCLMKDGQPYFTEINARLGGGAPMAAAVGANFPLWYLSQLAGLPYTVPPLGSYRIPIYLTRFDDSFYLTQQELDAIETQRVKVSED